jgi:hypothetical protein
MAHTTRSSDTPAGRKAVGTPELGGTRERRIGVRRVSLEQEKADFAAWLREYRRWTQTGCCAPARSGEIEWGGEDGGTSH